MPARSVGIKVQWMRHERRRKRHSLCGALEGAPRVPACIRET